MPESLRPLLPAVLLLALLSSCSRSTAPVAPASETPEATSAAGAVRLLDWAVNTGHAGVLEGLLSADFELAVAGLDSAGNQTRVDVPRDTVLAAFRSLLEGVPGRSAPATAQLVLDRNLIELPDTRPGRQSNVHRSLRTACDLRVTDSTAVAAFHVTGFLLCYMSRADSAALPAGSTAPADTSHWWITRIEDETSAGTPGTSAHPSKNMTLWTILDFYLARTRH